MKSLAFVLASISALFASATFRAQQQDLAAPTQKLTEPKLDTATPAQDKTKPFMRAKLVGSQKVLDGLVSENFTLIQQGAKNMKLISEAVQWPRAEDQVYDHYGDEFRNQCDKLMRLAEDKNLDGAHYTYLAMTTTCINCHNYVRSKFRVVRDHSDPQGPMRLIPTEWGEKSYR